MLWVGCGLFPIDQYQDTLKTALQTVFETGHLYPHNAIFVLSMFKLSTSPALHTVIH